jgi:hypothetical protein
MRRIIFSIVTVLLFSVLSVHASMACISMPAADEFSTIINFNDGKALGLKTGDKVTDQWEESGVTFGDGTVKWSKNTLLGSPGLYGSVFTGSIGSIYFNSDVENAAFQFYTLPTWESSITIQARNDGNVVETITIPQIGNWLQESVWYRFAGNNFDEIHFSAGSIYWALDNLKVNAVSAVPIPAAGILFVSGLAGLFRLRRRLAV